MIRLGLHFTLRGAKEGKIRLLLTSLGVALAVALLLFTLGGFNALKARDVRAAWLDTGEANRQPSVDENSSDPLWWRRSWDMFDGRQIALVEVAATGPHSPLVPGLDQQPQPEEFYVSPALEKLLAETPDELLGARFPETITGVLGEEALESPVSLVAVIGRSAAELGKTVITADGAEVSTAMQVRSLETAPAEHNYTEILRLVLGIGAVGLMLPVLVFVITSTRLAAARREERLAALRLVGATPGQVNLIASVEAGLAALTGTVLGFLFFYAFRPLAARIPFTGEPFFTSDVSLGWLAGIGVAVGVPVAAVAAGILTLRRVHVSPLGVTRKAPAPKPSALRSLALLIPLLAMGLLFAPGLFDHSFSISTVLVLFAAVAVGIVIAGPWLTYTGGRLLAAVARRDSTLIAARRLQGDPRRSFRAISGIVLAVFVGTVFVTTVDVATREEASKFPIRSLADSTVVQRFEQVPGGYPPAGAADGLIADVEALDGVDGVVPVLAWARQTEDGQDAGVEGMVTEEQWLLLGGAPESLAGSGYVAVATDSLAGGGYLFSSGPVSTAEAARVVAKNQVDWLLILTDGRQDTIERVRTLLEVACPEAPFPYSVGELGRLGEAVGNMLRRMVDVGVALCLLIAGCSLAVSVIGGLVERKRPFALLRLTGLPVRHLYRTVLLEAAVPLLVAAVLSAGVGFGVAALILWGTGNGLSLSAPGAAYYALVGGGLLAALGLVAASLPLVGYTTEPGSVRME